ncbi:efflux transporter outer membrane subunit [Planctomycetes bacterium K23_9]|uniref:Toluene efflux pump outer membrane protein TtgI n=1 Tax=Stieleria marina TaxID=1930275 RepID=A0A517NTW2_9BACT|nr:Toluene efflux pump outer membrane protein TtgI precursor [Planctomycetes bacterium K23_9]
MPSTSKFAIERFVSDLCARATAPCARVTATESVRVNATEKRRLDLQLVLCLLVLLTCGCKVGPDYRGAPLGSLPSSFVNSAQSDSWTAPNLPTMPADFRFNDPTLAALIDTALVDSPSVRELQWRVCEMRALVGLASGQGLPFADAGANYERRKRSSKSQPFVGPNGDAFDFFSIGALSRWEFDLVGRIARETEAATADYQASIEDVNDVRRLLIGEIARAYVQVRLYQELQKQNEINLKIQYSALEKVKGRIDAGKVGRLDLVQLQSRLRLTESDRPLFDEQLKLALTNLSILTGQPPTHQLIAMIGRGPQLQTPMIGHGIPADLIRHRPDMRRAEREVAAASARIGVAEAELYPKLSLLGTISVDSRNVSSLITSDALAYTIGPSVSWNILSLGRIQKAIEIQKAQLQQAIQRYQQTMLTAVADVENSLASSSENSRRIAILQQAVREAGEAVELASDQYDADKASLERVVSNQRRLLRASLDLANARAAKAAATVDLVQSIGVDWSQTPTTSAPGYSNFIAPQPTTNQPYVEAESNSSETESTSPKSGRLPKPTTSTPVDDDQQSLPNRMPDVSSSSSDQKTGGNESAEKPNDPTETDDDNQLPVQLPSPMPATKPAAEPELIPTPQGKPDVTKADLGGDPDFEAMFEAVDSMEAKAGNSDPTDLHSAQTQLWEPSANWEPAQKWERVKNWEPAKTETQSASRGWNNFNQQTR